MPTALQIVSDLAAAHIALALTPAGKIHASGPLTDVIRQTIRENRDAIAAALDSCKRSPQASAASTQPAHGNAPAQAVATPPAATAPPPPVVDPIPVPPVPAVTEPYLDGKGTLVIPITAAAKYRWWSRGQHSLMTLAELGASAEVITNYTKSPGQRVPCTVGDETAYPAPQAGRTPAAGEACAVCGAGFVEQHPVLAGDCPADRCIHCWGRGRDISSFKTISIN